MVRVLAHPVNAALITRTVRRWIAHVRGTQRRTDFNSPIPVEQLHKTRQFLSRLSTTFVEHDTAILIDRGQWSLSAIKADHWVSFLVARDRQ